MNESRGEWVRDWQQTETLLTVRELLDLGRRVGPAVAKRAGMSAMEMAALEQLAQRPMGPAELGRLLGVTSAAATGIIDRLGEHGHIERRPHGSDGRRTEVHMTESGRREAVGLLLPMFTEMAAADEELSEEEREVVLRYLRRMCQAMRYVI